MQLLSAPSDNRKYKCAFRSGECDGRGQRVKDIGKDRGKDRGKGKGKGKVTVYTGINSENILEE